VGRRDNTETFRNFGLLQIRFPGVCQQLHIVSWLDVHFQRSFHWGKYPGIAQHLLVMGMRGRREKERIYVSPWRSHNLTSEISNMHTARENAVLCRLLSWNFN
jgi:hypothetical protein